MTPTLRGVASADATIARAIRPLPPSFSLANTNTTSSAAMCFPPYMVFCAVKVNTFARGFRISVLIANAIAFLRRLALPSVSAA
ncbi:hypothetical protein [Bradyrhizobium sp. BR 1433]|uniref:hypothetical protein n=1 Tax=Bradyrhizobium sp. BR 1433 TaxID=3447967 RepID=UPI003EE6732B